MTNTEAFNEAMQIIEKNLQHSWWDNEPCGIFNIPMRTSWIWLRICDYFIVNKRYPKSYRSLHAWEKNYYGEK